MTDYRSLHPGQWEVAQSDARFRYLVCGRGWGKDHYAIADTLQSVTSPRAGPGFLALYVGPSHQQVKRIVWERFKRAIPAKYILGRPHETELKIRLRWGPIIQLVGSDHVDSLRGPDIHHLVITEFAFCRPELWTAVRPGLRTSADRATLITTPNGPNHAWELWRTTKGNPSWAHFQRPTWDNPFHDREAVEEARRTFARSHFDQEYGAKFEALEGAIYGDFSLERNVSDALRLDRNRTVYVGQDFNAGYIATVIGQVRGDELDIVDELITRTHIYDHVERLKAYFENQRIDWRTAVQVISDASGAYNATSGTSSDGTIMRKAGFRVEHDWTNPKVIDRIHSVQALILNAEGRVRLRVHPRCQELIRCLMGQVWDRWHKPDKSQGLDHLPDALGYLAHKLFPILPTARIEAV